MHVVRRSRIPRSASRGNTVSPGTSFSWVPNRNGITSAPCRTCNQLTPTCGCLTHCPFVTFNSGEAHLTRKLCSTVTSVIDRSRYLYVLSFSIP
ncbi:unnamed protein product [Musa hybrid cultivar]